MQVALEFEIAGADNIARLIATYDLKLTVVAPLVGIGNLVNHGVQFLEGTLSGRITHPRQRLHILLHGAFDFPNHLERGLLGFRAEILFYVGLPKGLA